MSKLRILTGAVLAAAALSFIWAGMASAHSFKTGNSITLGQGETVNDTVFLAGRNIDVSSNVNGDVFCAGQTISITGRIDGDVICAGQTISITGEVLGDVRLAGQTVNIDGTVAGNATIAGQSFNLASGGSIGFDASVAATDATLNGTIGRNLAAASESMTVANSVGGEIKASVSNLTLTENAKVAGNVNYTSWNEINRVEGASVGGEIIRSDPPKESNSPRPKLYYGFSFGWFIYWLLAFLMIAIGLTLLFPRLFQNVTSRGLPRPWKPLLVGFLAGLVVPVILLVLAVTVIGIPLAFLLGVIWFLVLLLSAPVFSFYLGRLMLRRSSQPLLIMLAGAAAFLVALFIPLIGLLAFLGAVWIGTGMLLLEGFDRTPRPVYSLEENSPKNTRRK